MSQPGDFILTNADIIRPGPGLVPLLPILSVNFVGTLGFSIVLPFLVFLVTDWGGNALVFGALASTYSAFQLIGAPVLGRWSDRIGRRRVLLVSQLGTLISWLVFLTAFFLPEGALIEVDSVLFGQFTITLPLVLLFLARATDGLTGGNVSVANAYLADMTDDRHRAENFGRMAMSTNAGFILGPALAGLLGATIYGEILPVIAALIISTIALFLIAFGLKESRPALLAEKPGMPNACKVFGQETKEGYRLEGCDETPTASIMRIPQMPALLTVNFLVMLGFSSFYVAFPTHAAIGLNWSVTDTGTYFAVLSLCMVIVQGPVLAWLSPRLSEKTLIVAGSLFLACGFAFLLANSWTAIYAAAILIALGNGLMWPTFMAVLSSRSGESMQGAVQGLASSLGAAASIAGLIAGGLLYTIAGPPVFLLSAATIAAAAILSLTISSQEATAKPEIPNS
ncbi:MFS transporter [Hoeflea prorocentri]|uniref:MFS transporter n=1 Tax=Hoeflea prorocentri TaxID=1922333 RepID=A0A9X3UFE7_9HYPH|nr:MFS transporter [Hoeflea prorocentri]MCY6379823.1 MFS transporter [Hoeflea prorocentri]MDA5397623.1 MFS transporter [Hoeflea prorocentri]